MKTCPKCRKTYEDRVQVCPEDDSALTPIDPMVGKLLADRYRLVEKIGEGGMGRIYKAVQIKMDRLCAIKLLTSLSSRDESAGARFAREARMASRIDNPHAVTIYDFGEAEEGVLYLAMEYIEGEPLSRVLSREGCLSAGRTAHIVDQIADALTSAHAMGIIHRDLKPDNVMLSRKGAERDYVKVLDFGIAKALYDDGMDNLTKTGFAVGTPVYMSPEQLTGDQLDVRSDTYSLAIMTYQMLSGRLPFEGDNVQAIMMKRITSEPILLRSVAPEIDQGVERVVMAALSRDRERRIDTAKSFAAELTQALSDGTQIVGSYATTPVELDSGRTAGRIDYGTRIDKTIGPPTSLRAAPRSSTDQPGFIETSAEEHQNELSINAPTVVDAAPRFQQGTVVAFGEETHKAAAKSGRKILIAGLILVVLGIAAGSYIAFSGGSSSSLFIEGAPPNADVFINDARVGSTDAKGNLVLTDLEAGELHVRLSREGFADFISKTTLEGKEVKLGASMLPLQIDYKGQMVLISAGEFIMGADNQKPTEGPPHRVVLPDFYIDKFEVTNRQYQEFCAATGRIHPFEKLDPDGARELFTNNPDWPVIGITWEDAAEFARWAGKRLPTEEEWEKAASWDQKKNVKRIWPWGDTAGTGGVNIALGKLGKPGIVGSHQRDTSPYGVMDMGGNAGEWVDAVYNPYVGGNNDADRSYSRGLHVIRGGNSSGTVEQGRTSFRGKVEGEKDPSFTVKLLVGFRCAADPANPNLRGHLRSYGR